MLQDDLYGYLQYVVKTYARGGIDPQEGLALYQLDKAVGSARAVDDSEVAKLATDASGNAKLSVEPRTGDPLGPLQEVEHPLPSISVMEGG
jgi:hypothetical protein